MLSAASLIDVTVDLAIDDSMGNVIRAFEHHLVDSLKPLTLILEKQCLQAMGKKVLL